MAAGYGSVGHLRLPGTKIHRALTSESETDEESAPDWMGLDYEEDEESVEEHEEHYES